MTNQHEGHHLDVTYPAVWGTSITVDGNTVVMRSADEGYETVPDGTPTFYCDTCGKNVLPHELGLTGAWDMTMD
jgi:hypothetical protein